MEHFQDKDIPAIFITASGDSVRLDLNNDKAESSQGCCERCASQVSPQCGGWTWVRSDHTCYLKTTGKHAFLIDTPLQNCLFTPELQRQSKGQMAYLTGMSMGNACGRCDDRGARGPRRGHLQHPALKVAVNTCHFSAKNIFKFLELFNSVVISTSLAANRNE